MEVLLHRRHDRVDHRLRRRIEGRRALGGQIGEWLEMDDPPPIGKHQTASVDCYEVVNVASAAGTGEEAMRRRDLIDVRIALVNVKDDPPSLRRPDPEERLRFGNGIAAGGDGKEKCREKAPHQCDNAYNSSSDSRRRAVNFSTSGTESQSATIPQSNAPL